MNLGLSISIGTSANGPNPATISGLLFRLRADTNVTLVSGRVSAWGDMSGNGNDFSQGTSGKRPLFNASGPGGLPSFTFSSARPDYLSGPSIDCSGFTGLSLVAILNFADTGTYSMFVAQDSKDELRSQGTNIQMASAGVDNCANPTARSGAWGVATGTHVASGSTTRVYWNNTEDASAPGGAGALGSAAFAIGSRGAGTLPMNGDLAEVLAYSKKLSTQEIALIVAYAARYGI